MEFTVVDHSLAVMAPDYQKAFGHLAYVVGKMQNASAEERERLIAEANSIVEAVYSPFPFIKNLAKV